MPWRRFLRCCGIVPTADHAYEHCCDERPRQTFTVSGGDLATLSGLTGIPRPGPATRPPVEVLSQWPFESGSSPLTPEARFLQSFQGADAWARAVAWCPWTTAAAAADDVGDGGGGGLRLWQLLQDVHFCHPPCGVGASGGRVFRALWHGSTIAVKLLVSDDLDMLQLSTREALLSRLVSHPHLVQCYTVCVTQLTAEDLQPEAHEQRWQQLLQALDGPMGLLCPSILASTLPSNYTTFPSDRPTATATANTIAVTSTTATGVTPANGGAFSPGNVNGQSQGQPTDVGRSAGHPGIQMPPVQHQQQQPPWTPGRAVWPLPVAVWPGSGGPGQGASSPSSVAGLGGGGGGGGGGAGSRMGGAACWSRAYTSAYVPRDEQGDGGGGGGACASHAVALPSGCYSSVTSALVVEAAAAAAAASLHRTAGSSGGAYGRAHGTSSSAVGGVPLTQSTTNCRAHRGLLTGLHRGGGGSGGWGGGLSAMVTAGTSLRSLLIQSPQAAWSISGGGCGRFAAGGCAVRPCKSRDRRSFLKPSFSDGGSRGSSKPKASAGAAGAVGSSTCAAGPICGGGGGGDGDGYGDAMASPRGGMSSPMPSPPLADACFLLAPLPQAALMDSTPRSSLGCTTAAVEVPAGPAGAAWRADALQVLAELDGCSQSSGPAATGAAAAVLAQQHQHQHQQAMTRPVPSHAGQLQPTEPPPSSHSQAHQQLFTAQQQHQLMLLWQQQQEQQQQQQQQQQLLLPPHGSQANRVHSGAGAVSSAAGTRLRRGSMTVVSESMDGVLCGSLEEVNRILDELYGMGAGPGKYLTAVLMEYCEQGTLLDVLQAQHPPQQRRRLAVGRSLMPRVNAIANRYQHTAAARGGGATAGGTGGGDGGGSGSVNPRASPTWQTYDILVNALEVAQGMAYLHSLNLVHGDLKPANVLVRGCDGGGDGIGGRRYTCKISDFGLTNPVAATSRGLSRNKQNSSQWGALAYMAPEVPAGRCGKPSDVHSFGAMLWHLATGLPPHHELHPAQLLVGLVSGELSLEWPPGVDPTIRRIGQACMAREPKQRPTFEAIVRILLVAVRRAARKLRAAAVAAAAPPPPPSASGGSGAQAQPQPQPPVMGSFTVWEPPQAAAAAATAGAAADVCDRSGGGAGGGGGGGGGGGSWREGPPPLVSIVLS